MLSLRYLNRCLKIYVPAVTSCEKSARISCTKCLSHHSSLHTNSKMFQNIWKRAYTSCKKQIAIMHISREYQLYVCNLPRDTVKSRVRRPLSTSSRKNTQNVEGGEVTVEDALKACVQKLESHDVPEAELQAEYIISHVLGINRVDLNKEGHRILNNINMDKMGVMMDCRMSRMPLQYIIGDWDFHSIQLKLRPPVFIPRAETETLVELALKELENCSSKKLKILDACCGSGAIGLAILMNNPKITCHFVDQSDYAIDLTRENAANLNLIDRVKTVHHKFSSEPLPDTLSREKFDLIVSNPPYVPRKETLGIQKEILLYEDMAAIDGGDDGLDVMKLLLTHCQDLLTPCGVAFIEIDPSHVNLLPSWLDKYKIGMKMVGVFKDFAGKDRFIKLSKG